MTNMGTRRRSSARWALAALAATMATAARSRAQTTDSLDVVIDCARLDGDAQAELEARVRADMAARQRAQGTVSVVCGSLRATIEWHPPSGAATSHTITLPEDVKTLNERVLEVLADLARANTPGPVRSSGGAPPETKNAPERRDQRRAARTREAAELEESEPAHERVLGIDDENGRTPHAAKGKPATRHRGVLVAGAVGEAWSGDIAVALGARAGICFETPLPDACVTFSGLRGLGSSNGLSATLFDLALALDFPLEHRRQFWLGAGVAGLMLIVGARDNLQPESQTALAAALSLRIRHTLEFGDWSLRYGPELRLDTNSLIARVDVVEAFRVPQLSLGVGIEIGFAP